MYNNPLKTMKSSGDYHSIKLPYKHTKRSTFYLFIEINC